MPITVESLQPSLLNLNKWSLTLQKVWKSNTHPNSNKIRVMRELLSQWDRQLIRFECSDLPWARDKVHPASHITKDYMIVATCSYGYMCILAKDLLINNYICDKVYNIIFILYVLNIWSFIDFKVSWFFTKWLSLITSSNMQVTFIFHNIL